MLFTKILINDFIKMNNFTCYFNSEHVITLITKLKTYNNEKTLFIVIFLFLVFFAQTVTFADNFFKILIKLHPK